MTESSDFHITPEEARVLDLLVTGMTNAQIAERLGKSKDTVRAQVRSLLAKSRLSGRVSLAVFWERHQTFEAARRLLQEAKP